MVSVTKMWKQLPMNIRKKSTVTSFKNNLINHFKNSYNDLDHFNL